MRMYPSIFHPVIVAVQASCPHFTPSQELVERLEPLEARRHVFPSALCVFVRCVEISITIY